MPRKIPSTKLDLVRALSAKADVSQTKVEEILDALAAFAYAGAPSRRGFSIPGIGRLSVITRKARRAFNPATGRAIRVPAKTALSFRFSKLAKEAILPGIAVEAKKKTGTSAAAPRKRKSRG